MRLASTIVLALCGSCASESPGTSPPAPGGGPILYVRDAIPEDAGTSAGRSLAELARAAEPGTELHLGVGEYVLDNPLVLRTPGLILRGEGLATTLVPLHPGRPVIIVEADAVGLEALVIDAQSDDGGRATFAVELDGCSGCRLADLTIAGTGATSVRGIGLTDFRAEDNRVLDAGDDSFFLRGDGIRLLDNVAARFLDEAIDISGESTGALLRSNCVSSGRIGIAITLDQPVVNNNIVEDVVMNGIFVHSTDGSGIITSNVTSHTGGDGLFLREPLLVGHNEVDNAARVGIRIAGMRNGIVQENFVRDSEFGFELQDVTNSFVHLNRYQGETATFLEFRGRSDATTVRENTVEPPEVGDDVVETAAGLLASRRVREGACLGLLAPEERRLLEKSLASRNVTSLHVGMEGRSDREQRILALLLELWAKNNPGVLAIDIDGPSMTTPITPELLTILRGGDVKAIGIVRYPALLLGRMSSSAAEWRLLVDGSHVATVRPDGTEEAGAIISFVPGSPSRSPAE